MEERERLQRENAGALEQAAVMGREVVHLEEQVSLVSVWMPFLICLWFFLYLLLVLRAHSPLLGCKRFAGQTP